MKGAQHRSNGTPRRSKGARDVRRGTGETIRIGHERRRIWGTRDVGFGHGAVADEHSAPGGSPMGLLNMAHARRHHVASTARTMRGRSNEQPHPGRRRPWGRGRGARKQQAGAALAKARTAEAGRRHGKISRARASAGRRRDSPAAADHRRRERTTPAAGAAAGGPPTARRHSASWHPTSLPPRAPAGRGAARRWRGAAFSGRSCSARPHYPCQ